MIKRVCLYKFDDKSIRNQTILNKFKHYYDIKALLFMMQSLNVLHDFNKSVMINQMVGIPMQFHTIGVVKRSLTWKRHQ